MGIYICILLSLICLSILIYSTFKSDYKFRLIAKIFTSLCFLLVSLFSYLSNPINPKYFFLIFIGLIFSFIGDVLLGINTKNHNIKTNLFLSGGFAFSITHIFYSICFITLVGIHIRDFIYAIFISFILLSTLICNKKLTINKYHLPGIIYCLIIGATLFVISDYLLSLFLLNKNCPKFISRLNLITYYLGQILIALSILYIA